MYSVNGIPLDNTTFGWFFRAPSKPLSEFSRDRESLRVTGRDGVVAGLAATISPVTLPLVVRTPKANLETLVALFGAVGMLSLSGVSSREVAFETLSHSLVGYGAADAVVDATFLIRLPGAFWRAKTTSTTAAESLTAASETVDVFSGMSAPVQDALIRVKGSASGIRVTDSSGAWVALPEVTASQYVRFESDSGRAFVTTSDSWGGGTDVSGDVDFGGPRGVFEITPVLAAGNPSSRKGVLTVSTASRVSASVQVRGKSAFVL